MLVTGIGSFDHVGAGTHPENEINDVLERYIA
jgi:hypothetical protein